jgi:hypothetical protein
MMCAHYIIKKHSTRKGIKVMTAALNNSSNNKSIRAVLVTALALTPFFALSNASACASCGCTLSTDWGSQGISTKEGWSYDLSDSYINQNTLIYGNSKPSAAFVQSLYANGTEIETSTVTQTVTNAFNYNSDTWGVSIQIPFLMRTHGTNGTTTNGGADYGANFQTSDRAGLGDIRVVGHYSGFFDDKTSGLILGVKLATGETGADFTGGAAAGQAGVSLDPGLQIGTGSTDVILGAYTSGAIRTYGWFVQGTVQHAVSPLATEAGGVTYRPGDAYLVNTGIRYAGFGASVSPMLQLNFIHREYDQGTGVPTDVFTGNPISGGNLAYLSPGVSVRVGGGMSVYGFVQIPIYENVGSLQLVPSYIANIGVHQNF